MATDKEKRAKFIYYFLMTLTAPIYIPLCILYGLIIGPIGHQFFLFQYHRDAYLRNIPKYRAYKTGAWKPAQEKFNRVDGTWTYESPPPSPLQFIFILIFFEVGMLPLSIFWGVISGPISAIFTFQRRIYLKFFPKEVLVGTTEIYK